MKRLVYLCLVATLAANNVYGQYAVEVISYDPGTNSPAIYTTPSTALGSPERFTGEGIFPGLVTVFNPPFGTDEIVSVGEEGHITLRLSHFAIPGAGPEIGVFENAGFIDFNYPDGLVGTANDMFGIDSAEVAVSEDGLTWESLGLVTFSIPTQGYSDVAGSIESDFQQPFTGDITEFEGLPLSDPANPDILELLNGSGGGTWIDISATSFSKVGYIRFSVAAETGTTLELDAVSISASAMGGRVPEPGSIVFASLLLICGTMRRR